jgi:hypothetical protein
VQHFLEIKKPKKYQRKHMKRKSKKEEKVKKKSQRKGTGKQGNPTRDCCLRVLAWSLYLVDWRQ